MFQAEDVDYFGKVGFGEGIRSEEDLGLDEENWGV